MINTEGYIFLKFICDRGLIALNGFWDTRHGSVNVEAWYF